MIQSDDVFIKGTCCVKDNLICVLKIYNFEIFVSCRWGYKLISFFYINNISAHDLFMNETDWLLIITLLTDWPAGLNAGINHLPKEEILALWLRTLMTSV